MTIPCDRVICYREKVTTVRPQCGLTDCQFSIKWITNDACLFLVGRVLNKCSISAYFATTNFGYTVYNASIYFGYIGRNFGYFWVFWRIFFGYTGIPLPPWPTLTSASWYLATSFIKLASERTTLKRHISDIF